ncbi:hypothetical protein FHR71_001732 [Methylobacterium sp. RAS18]|nr:hypothetical protein [Methylobacterium sp. RAS18]
MAAEDYPIVRLANSAGTVVDPATGSGGGGGGGGSTPSSTLSVQRATGTGTTASIASAASTTARRTIRNIGTSAIEFGPSGVTYGAGHPLPAGESFTFDDTGRYTGAVYCVAAGGVAWATSTVSY